MNISTKHFYVLILLYTISCTEVVNLDHPSTPPQLVVSSIIRPDCTISLKLYKSQEISKPQISKVTEATISLFENNKYIGRLKEHPDAQYRIAKLPLPNKEYSITIKKRAFVQLILTNQFHRLSMSIMQNSNMV